MYRTIPQRRSLRQAEQRAGFTLVELLVVIGAIAVLIALLLPSVRRSVQASQQLVCMNKLRQLSQATLMYCHDNDGAFPGWAQYHNGDLALMDWIYWEEKSAYPFNDVSRSPIAQYMNHAGAIAFRCPADPVEIHANPYHDQPFHYSYVLNMWTSQMKVQASDWIWPDQDNRLPITRLKDVRDPSEIIFFADEDPRLSNDGTWWNKTGAFDAISDLHDTFHDVQDDQKRGNVAFCDGHAEFVTQAFARSPEHFYPR